MQLSSLAGLELLHHCLLFFGGGLLLGGLSLSLCCVLSGEMPVGRKEGAGRGFELPALGLGCFVTQFPASQLQLLEWHQQ